MGSGFCGDVKIATHRLLGVKVALKTLRKALYEESGQTYPPREIALMQNLRHPSCAHLWHTIVKENAIYLVTELVEGGELLDYISQHDSLPESEARRLLRQLVDALRYLHSQNIVHRDLKLENILLDAYGNIKIIDYGLGNFYDPTGQHLLNTFCGSPDYAAPEMWKAAPYTGPEVDVWSLGVILYVLVTGFVPFGSSALIVQLQYRWPSSTKPSPELQDLVDRIFKAREDRITLEAIAQHPWTTNKGRLRSLQVEYSRPTIDGDSVDECTSLGLPRDELIASLESGRRDMIVATYEMVYAKRRDLAKRRGSNAVSMTAASPSLTRSAGYDEHARTPALSPTTSSSEPPPPPRDSRRSDSGSSGGEESNEEEETSSRTPSNKNCVVM